MERTEEVAVQGNSMFSAVETGMKGVIAEAELARLALDAIESERDTVLERVKGEFEDQISQAKSKLRTAERAASHTVIKDMLRDLPIDEVEATAFDIALRIEDMSLTDLAIAYEHILTRQDIGYQQRRTYERVEGFSSFYRELPEDGAKIPTLAIQLGWQEQYDVQAEHEGRPSATEVYEKECTVLFSEVGRKDIIIRHAAPVTNGFASPEGPIVGVAISTDTAEHTKLIVSELKWGCVETELSEIKPSEILSLLDIEERVYDEPTGFRTVQKVNWSKSAEHDYSLLSPRPGSGLVRSEPTKFFVYGDQVAIALEKLLADEEIPDVTKRHLRLLQEETPV